MVLIGTNLAWTIYVFFLAKDLVKLRSLQPNVIIIFVVVWFSVGQHVIVIRTLVDAGSTWNCTDCLECRAVVSVYDVVITLMVVIVSTASQDTTEIAINPCNTARHVEVHRNFKSDLTHCRRYLSATRTLLDSRKERRVFSIYLTLSIILKSYILTKSSVCCINVL